MKKTVLAEFIDDLIDARNNIESMDAPGTKRFADLMILELKRLLPNERIQIEEAYDAGCLNGYYSPEDFVPSEYEDEKDYFTKTYEQNTQSNG